MDVFDVIKKRKPVKRQMRLEKTSMFLGLDPFHESFDRSRKPAIDPSGNPINHHGFRRLENQQADDALHPGCAAFWISRDHDVIRSRSVMRPPPAIEDPG